MAVHERVWERSPDPRRAYDRPVWQPKGSYVLLAAMVGVWILQWISVIIDPTGRLHGYIFVIHAEWWLQPWALITSTLSHSLGGFGHLFFNGLVFFFFGPTLERLIGTRKLVILFFLSGALSGLIQVTITGGGALGASGAIMMVFGALIAIMPNEKLLIYGIVPVPFWAAGVGYALLDTLGIFVPGSNIGHFAHLSGMAIGLWFGLALRKQWDRRGLKLVTH